MVKDYRWLWEDVAGASDEGEAIRTLAEILLDEEGRTFILNLERDDAELCIEILDLVSLIHVCFLSVVLDGFARALESTISKLQRSRPSSLR